MLAYLDDILKADDAQAIGKKIEESQFATGLLHRIRDCMRKLRLAAPSVTDNGPGLDPNTVAEYLDNTLPGERVPDFEKVCLESDIHLAEVASCHQILTLVLGEPVEIDPVSRQRMYQLPDLTAAEASGENLPGAAVVSRASLHDTPEDLDPKKLRAKPNVPEYLRESTHATRRRVLAPMAAIALILLIGAVVLTALNQFERGSWLAKLFRVGAAQREIATAPQEPNAPPVRTADVAPPAPPVAVTPAEKGPEVKETPAPPKESPIPAKEAPAPAKETPSPAKEPAGGSKAMPGGKGGDSTPVIRPAETGALENPAAIAKEGDKTPSAVAPESPAPPRPLPEPDPAMRPAKGEVALAKNGSGPGASVPPPPRPLGEPPADVAPMPVEQAGRFASDKQVLLQFDGNLLNWRRVAAHASLNSATPLLSLPPYQPTIAMTSGTLVQMAGGTLLELLPADVKGASGVKVRFGRLIARTTGGTKSRLALKFGQRSGTISFKTADSAVAIAVYHQRAIGANPESDPGPLAADMYALSGEFAWEESSPPSSDSVAAPGQLRIVGKAPPAAIAVRELPKWTAGDDASYLDRHAAPTLEQSLLVDRAVALGLRELVEHRRSEVGWLAIRCLGYLGQFEPMVTVLNSLDQKAIWDDTILHLQEVLSCGPELATAVRRALEKHYPQDAAAMYRMLWGYSEKDLKGAAGTALLAGLDSDSLACRALAFNNLEKITGVKYAYRVQETVAAKRQPAVVRFKERLQAIAGDTTTKEESPPPAPHTPP